MSADAAAFVPDRIEVTGGVFFDEITSIEQCDRIQEQLIADVARIEDQVAHAKLRRATVDESWFIRAKRALRIKKMCLPKMQELRARLGREARAKAHEETMEAYRRAQDTKDRIFARIAWEIAPDTAAKVRAVACERHPDVFAADEDQRAFDGVFR